MKYGFYVAKTHYFINFNFSSFLFQLARDRLCDIRTTFKWDGFATFTCDSPVGKVQKMRNSFPAFAPSRIQSSPEITYEVCRPQSGIQSSSRASFNGFCRASYRTFNEFDTNY